MIAAAATGELTDRGKGPFELAQMEEWGKTRTVRAEVLRGLLVENCWPVAAKGVRLRGVGISGPLDLKGAKLRCSLCLDSCYLDGPAPDLGFASVSLLEMKGCHLDGLAAESLVVSADFDMSASTCTGSIQLDGAAIAGQLNCCGAILKGRDENGNALTAEGLKVGADLILREVTTDTGAIQLIGADITGQLNCSGARLISSEGDGDALIADTIKVGGGVFLGEEFTARGGISLRATDITGPLDCSTAKLYGKDKDGFALDGAGMKVGGFVYLAKLFTDAEAGAFRLASANIALQLTCKEAELNGMGPKGSALYADSITVGGDVTLADVCITRGAIRLASAHIKGDLHCRELRLRGGDKDDNALLADSAKVGGSVIMNDVTVEAGAIRLPGANITGRLRCGPVTLDGRDKRGRTLLADGMTVGGGAWFRGIRTTRGGIRMICADIRGDLEYEGVRLEGTDDEGRSLVADRIKVSGDVYLGSSEHSGSKRESIAAEGSVSLKSARVGGSLELNPAKLAEGNDSNGKPKVALDLAGARIADALVWEPSQAIRGQVILDDAEIDQLKDSLTLNPNGHWPSALAGLLRLDGFTYNRICEEPESAVEKRLAWIGSPSKPVRKNTRRGFTTQPYEQLAAIYRKSGQDTEARKVAIARRRDLRRYGDHTPGRKVGNWLLDISIGYGYRTWRVVAALAVLYAITSVIFLIAQHNTQLIVPTMQHLNPVPTAIHCTSNYPCFYPAAYAIDTFIPIINVHQATYWGPNGHAAWGHALAVFTWVGTVVGWILATLTAAGYTGLVRRE